MHTGLVPQTFYALPHGPEEHFDGMPIDFVSSVIASTTLAERNAMATYHVVNPHWWAITTPSLCLLRLFCTRSPAICQPLIMQRSSAQQAPCL